jgi:hypothetical protein
MKTRSQVRIGSGPHVVASLRLAISACARAVTQHHHGPALDTRDPSRSLTPWASPGFAEPWLGTPVSIVRLRKRAGTVLTTAENRCRQRTLP